MPRNGSGSYSLPAGNPVVTGTTISSTTHNTTMSDIATALTASLAKDGQTTPTANLPMGTFRHTGVGAASALTDYARADQVQNSSFITLSSVAGTNTITASATPIPSAYAVGQSFEFVPANTNTGATTLNISSLGAGAVQANGTALVGGEIKQNVPVVVKVTATTPVFELLSNGATSSPIEIVTHSATSKGTPVDADEIPLADSAASFVLKKLTWANIKATLKAYFDTLYAAITVSTTPSVRQTVLSGPVDSSGVSAFGGSTGSTTVTASGTLKATAAAGGDANYTGSITNPSWTGLSTNGTMYLNLQITPGGVVSTVARTLNRIEQWGGTYSTTNGQLTFNIQEATMKLGNGSTASQVYEVPVGEVTVAGGVVTAITWYALMGRYMSSGSLTVPSSSATSVNHNIGVQPLVYKAELVNVTADAGYTTGDVIDITSSASYYNTKSWGATVTRMTIQVSDFTGPPAVVNKAGSAINTITAGNWNLRLSASRGY